ncbi:bifunctional folylpolyglutamate synthase/dihydrofolate synthase [Lacticaseibacillus baoqingensis]|uniref:tetrahydrofolate synthase n=1 Tax=Lacticaseibacillus baoqingensis TaxID=2486013 RepID=A0ABW4E4N7_9LACO|nr:folylpolyglutamate synthase/dihydrofolate synthase family protein [Lacticaseibacillus baoqingensis]
MDYQTSVTYIHSQPRLAKDGSLERIDALLAALDHPEHGQRYVHVTGTNGKGSVANGIAHILEASGLSVGLFTSPFIMRFNERIMIDHQPLLDARLAQAATITRNALENLQAQNADFVVTEFEFITAMALWAFRQAAVDVAVIEVGIGGKEDSTNVIMPKVAVITSVGMDHQALLGNTLTSIATHKAGIIKPQVPVVTGVLPEAAQAVVAARVQATGSTWWQSGRDFSAGAGHVFDWGQRFDYQDADGKMPAVEVPLVGTFQPGNMAVAIRAAKAYATLSDWPLTPREIRKGLAKSVWPGRMEKISADPLIILDGAHNPQGIQALITTMTQLFGAQTVTVIAGVLKDKDVTTMVDALGRGRHRLWLVPVPDTPRATAVQDYPAGIRHFDQWQQALATHLQNHADEPLVITGSLYLVAAVRQALCGQEEDHDR